MNWSQLVRRSTAPFVFLIQFALVMLMMRLDPDPHHDGILYGAAVNVRGGGFPNRDAFAQYGPLIPEVQGLWLRIFGPSLLGIRIQAAVVFLIVSIIIWRVSRNYVSNSLALLISSSWTLTIPSVLPWPTIYTTCLALVSMILIVDTKTRKIQENKYLIFISGSIISIGTFGRIHLIAIFVLVSLFFFIKRAVRQSGYIWIAGFSATTISILLILRMNNSLSSFISQCITWPFARYAGPTINKSYIVGLIWYPAVAITFILLLLVISSRKYQRIPRPVALVLPAAIFILFYAASRIERIGYLSLRNPRVLLIDFGRNMMSSIDYAAAFVMFISVLIMFLRRNKFSIIKQITILFALGIATQLYPLYDVNHLWMISPIFICSILVTYGDTKQFIKFIQGNLGLLLFGLCTALIIQIFSFTSVDRVEFKSPTLQGMYAPKDFAIQLDQTLLNLESYLSPQSASFDCLNGLYAGAGGRYLASSEQFVNWGPSPEAAQSGEKLFVCAIPNERIESYIDSGYQILFKDPLTLFGDSQPRGYWNILFSKTS